MEIKIDDIKNISNTFLGNIGFSTEEANLVTNNLLEAEVSGRESHGFRRLVWFKRLLEEGRIKPSSENVKIAKETPTSIFVDGLMKPGAYVEYKTLELALEKVKTSGIVIGGTTNSAPSHGFIGHYARVAAENNLIYLGFHNSDSLTVPHGSSEPLWGTNPLTIGIPSVDSPVILDMASTKTTYGAIMVASQKGEKVDTDLVVNKEGEITIDPNEVIDGGGFLPFAGYKGSGLAFIVELLAGALTDSRVGKSKPGGWGGTFILINPALFRPLEDFKQEVDRAIKELKNSRKMKGVAEIYYPGEQSLNKRRENLEKGEIEIEDNLYKSITT